MSVNEEVKTQRTDIVSDFEAERLGFRFRAERLFAVLKFKVRALEHGFTV
jgi:hypothetical protein